MAKIATQGYTRLYDKEIGRITTIETNFLSEVRLGFMRVSSPWYGTLISGFTRVLLSRLPDW